MRIRLDKLLPVFIVYDSYREGVYCLKKTTGYASGSKETVSMSRKSNLLCYNNVGCQLH